MKRSTVQKLFISFLVVLCSICFSFSSNTSIKTIPVSCNNCETNKRCIYETLHLSDLGLSRAAFDDAILGYNSLLSQGKILDGRILSIIDFSLPSDKKRLFILDIKNNRLVFNTYVSHGKNSGKALATSFSNAPNSFQSSLGFYITGDTYNGHHGYSMRLMGEEKGINDNAFSRGIVMHSAAYVDESFIHAQGYIGRSEGCPAVPESLYKVIIQQIKNGTCLFMFSPDKNYFTHSSIIHSAA